jgi:hypothetical protein
MRNRPFPAGKDLIKCKKRINQRISCFFWTKVKNMDRGLKTWCFILLLPVLAALAHDFYASYANTPEKRTELEALQVEPEGFMTSDLGYLFVTYARDQFDAAREGMDPVLWDSFINPVLELPTFVVAGIPALVFFAYLLIAWPLGLKPFDSRHQTKANKLDRFGKKAGGYKFTRK